MAGLAALAAFIALSALAGCGGSDAETPDGAVQAYLDGLADGNLEEACALLVDAEEQESCREGPPVPEEFKEVLGNVDRVTTTEESGDDATVLIFLEGAETAEAEVLLDKVGEEWRLATQPSLSP